MLEHTYEPLDVLQYLYSDRLLLFMYDWSSGRTKYPSGALNVNVMQVNFGCKQERLAKLNPTTIVQDYVYPDNFPENLLRLKKYKLYELKQQIHNKQKLDEMVHLLNEMRIPDTSCNSEMVVLDAVESNIYRGTEFSELLAQLEIIADDDMFD